MSSKQLLMGLLSLCLLVTVSADTHTAPRTIHVVDDHGRSVRLAQPAQRIISLAPNITENLFAIGAGALIVGTVSFSDYPPEAEELARVGAYNQLDLEAIVASQPDLVIAWSSGNPRPQIETLERLGLTVYYTEPRRFEDIATTLHRFGQLSGQTTQAAAAIAQFEARYRALHDEYAHRAQVRLFYQVWEQPLMTINREHLIQQAIETCGGVNVFADLDRLIPRISHEAVIAQNPDALVGGGMGEDNPAWMEAWRQWPHLQAVAQGHLFFIPPSLLQRHTTRILDGTALLCEQLEQVRQAANSYPP